MSTTALSLSDQIHAHALEAASRYIRAELELIDVFQLIEDHQVHLRRNHASLFAYATDELKLARNLAYHLIAIARKAREVPRLKALLQVGKISLSNARRVVAVLEPSNQDEWLRKASELSNRMLEKEIARVRPQILTPERASYVTDDRLKLELGLSEGDLIRLRRVQDLICQSKRRPISLEETLSEMTTEYLRRHDPALKAARRQARKGGLSLAEEPKELETPPSSPSISSRDENKVQSGQVSEPQRRAPIPAGELHRVHFRDKGRCAKVLPNGLRCNQGRWIEIHHIIPVSEGGQNSADNLITLCASHHRRQHLPS